MFCTYSVLAINDKLVSTFSDIPRIWTPMIAPQPKGIADASSCALIKVDAIKQEGQGAEMPGSGILDDNVPFILTFDPGSIEDLIVGDIDFSGTPWQTIWIESIYWSMGTARIYLKETNHHDTALLGYVATYFALIREREMTELIHIFRVDVSSFTNVGQV